MLDLRLVFKRLQEQVVNLDFIGDAIDLAETEKLESIDKPSAYIELKNMVALDEFDSGFKPLRGKTRQYVLVSFSVTVVTNNQRYQSALTANSLESVVQKIRNALVGWIPDMPTARSCQLQTGEMQAYNNKMQVWQDVYQVSYAIGSGL